MQRDHVPNTLRDFLAEVGRVYIPFLVANIAASEPASGRVECTVDGHPWMQRPFPYQGKCPQLLRESYRRLEAADRRTVDALLEDALTVPERRSPQEAPEHTRSNKNSWHCRSFSVVGATSDWAWWASGGKLRKQTTGATGRVLGH